MNKLLDLLSQDARISNSEIAVMLGISEDEVKEKIALYEDTGVIKGYKAIIDKNKAHISTTSAIIEITVQPKFIHGFDELAEKISNFEEVESIYLMSGGFDFAVMVTDKSFEEVAMFVANRLAPLDGVISTATHFVLKKYKEQGVQFAELNGDDRGNISLWLITMIF